MVEVGVFDDDPWIKPFVAAGPSLYLMYNYETVASMAVLPDQSSPRESRTNEAT